MRGKVGGGIRSSRPGWRRTRVPAAGRAEDTTSFRRSRFYARCFSAISSSVLPLVAALRPGGAGCSPRAWPVAPFALTSDRRRGGVPTRLVEATHQRRRQAAFIEGVERFARRQLGGAAQAGDAALVSLLGLELQDFQQQRQGRLLLRVDKSRD